MHAVSNVDNQLKIVRPVASRMPNTLPFDPMIGLTLTGNPQMDHIRLAALYQYSYLASLPMQTSPLCALPQFMSTSSQTNFTSTGQPTSSLPGTEHVSYHYVTYLYSFD